MVKVSTYFQMAIHIKENTKMGNLKVKEFIGGRTAQYMKVTFITALKVVKESGEK